MLISIVGGLAVLAGILGGFQLWWHLHPTTAGEVESTIERNLSPEASTEEIFAFLDREGIGHGDVRRVDGTSYLLDEGYDPDTRVIAAIMWGTSRSLFVFSGDIQIGARGVYGLLASAPRD